MPNLIKEINGQIAKSTSSSAFDEKIKQNNEAISKGRAEIKKIEKDVIDRVFEEKQSKAKKEMKLMKYRRKMI